MILSGLQITLIIILGLGTIFLSLFLAGVF
jgi:hypothetical protein